MNSELRERLKKPPPTATRYGLSLVNWVGAVAAGLLVPVGLGALLSIATFVAASFSTGSRC